MSYRSCDTCTETGRAGYCAPLRCYCGHKACSAFPSYVDTGARTVNANTFKNTANLHAKSWAEREEETWLERL
jgi:hypothetical protein